MAATERGGDTRRRVVVVAGMHRAGTSVVARGLMALGLDLGDALMAADVRMNARGFFEDTDVVKANDALLDAQGADWKSVALLDDVDWSGPAHAEARAAARQLLAARLARSGSFAFKDPRVPRLLPFWRAAFDEMGVDDAYVIAVRHPWAVRDSLTARDDLDPRRSVWLWLSHLLCALRYTQGRPRVVVDYDRLLEAPGRELARMAAALGLPAGALARAEADPYVRDFLTADLRHAHYADDEPPATPLVPGVAQAHALARRLARDEADAGDAAVRADIDRQFAELAAMSPLLAYAGALERAADDVPRLTGELAWARATIAGATTYNDDLLAKIGRDREYQVELAAALERKEAELREAHLLLARLRERLLGRLLVYLARRNAREQ